MEKGHKPLDRAYVFARKPSDRPQTAINSNAG
jgi:hypothetical protein